SALGLARLVQTVARRHGLAQERPRDEEHRDDGEGRREGECPGHQATTAPGSYRSASRRCSTASGHIAISAPPTNTNPASQLGLPSGFPSSFRSTALPETACAVVKTSPIVRGSW